MRRILAIVVSLSLLFSVEVCANDIEEPKGIYALSAVLMDAESGRILFAKEGEAREPAKRLRRYSRGGGAVSHLARGQGGNALRDPRAH